MPDFFRAMGEHMVDRVQIFIYPLHITVYDQVLCHFRKPAINSREVFGEIISIHILAIRSVFQQGSYLRK